MNSPKEPTKKRKYVLTVGKEERKRRKTKLRLEMEKNIDALQSSVSARIVFSFGARIYDIQTTVADAVDILLNGDLTRAMAAQVVAEMSLHEKVRALIRLHAINNILNFYNAPPGIEPSGYDDFINSAEAKAWFEQPDFTELLIKDISHDVIKGNNVTLVCSETKYNELRASGVATAINAKGYRVNTIKPDAYDGMINHIDNANSISFSELLYNPATKKEDDLSIFQVECAPVAKKFLSNYKFIITGYEDSDLKLNDKIITSFVYILDLFQNNSNFRHAFMNIHKQHRLWIEVLKEFVNKINVAGDLYIADTRINSTLHNQDREAYASFVCRKIDVCRSFIKGYGLEQAYYAKKLIFFPEKVPSYTATHKLIESDLLFLDDRLWNFDNTSVDVNSTKSLKGMQEYLYHCIRIPPVLIDYINSKLSTLYGENCPKIEQQVTPELLRKEVTKLLLIMDAITRTERKIKALNKKLQEKIDEII